MLFKEQLYMETRDLQLESTVKEPGSELRENLVKNWTSKALGRVGTKKRPRTRKTECLKELGGDFESSSTSFICKTKKF